MKQFRSIVPMEALEEVACPICAGSDRQPLFTISQFHIVQCLNCQLVYTNPRLRREKLLNLYDQTYFKSNNSLTHGYEDYEFEKENIKRTFTRRWLKTQGFSSHRNGNLLDIGCAFGFLLDMARTDGWEVLGIDTSYHAVCYARRTFGVEVKCSDISDLDSFSLPDTYFDTIVMWDVLEHLPDPILTLHHCYKKLRSGGVISLITPDQGSLLARLSGKRWVEYQKPGEHIYFFSRRILIEVLRKTGFSIEWTGTAGKFVTLNFALDRLRAYQPYIFSPIYRLAKWLHVDSAAFYANPGDKMFVIARKA